MTILPVSRRLMYRRLRCTVREWSGPYILMSMCMNILMNRLKLMRKRIRA